MDQNPERSIRSQIARVFDLYGRGQYEVPLLLARESCAEARQLLRGGHPALVAGMNNLAVCFKSLNEICFLAAPPVLDAGRGTRSSSSGSEDGQRRRFAVLRGKRGLARFGGLEAPPPSPFGSTCMIAAASG